MDRGRLESMILNYGNACVGNNVMQHNRAERLRQELLAEYDRLVAEVAALKKDKTLRNVYFCVLCNQAEFSPADIVHTARCQDIKNRDLEQELAALRAAVLPFYREAKKDTLGEFADNNALIAAYEKTGAR